MNYQTYAASPIHHCCRARGSRLRLTSDEILIIKATKFLLAFHITNRTYVTWPRAQPGRGAMWRSGAPQRRVARGAFLGADVHTCCYTQLRCTLWSYFLLDNNFPFILKHPKQS